MLRRGCLCIVLIILLGYQTSAAQVVTVTADASTNLGTFDNIAGGINFWGRDIPQEGFIEEIGTDIYRVKIVLREVEKRGDSYFWTGWGGRPGQPSSLAQNLNRAKGRGAKIMFQIYGIPKWLSLSDDGTFMTNNQPNYAKYPPSDYEEWANIVSYVVSQLIEVEGVKADYYEIFGEPNYGSTWYQQYMPCKKVGGVITEWCPNELGHNTVQVLDNFYKIYEYTAKGIRDADPAAEIGGVAIGMPVGLTADTWWTRLLLQHIKANNLPLDFYSWHTYGSDEHLSGTLNLIEPYKPLTIEKVRSYHEPRLRNKGFSDSQIDALIQDIYSYLKALEQQDQEAVKNPHSFMSSQFKEILNEEGFSNSELLLTEWNVNGWVDERHDTHYGASFITRGLIDITDSDTDLQSFYDLSRYDLVGYPYGGDFELFTSDGSDIPKAGFNAFKSFAMLGDGNQRVSVTSSSEDVYSIATKDQDSVSVLTTYYVMDEKPNYGQTKDVKISIKDIPFSQYDYRIYLIDKEHSNSFYDSGPELEIIDQGSSSGDFQKDMRLPIYGVVLVKLQGSRTGPVCGNGICEDGETEQNCPEDCSAPGKPGDVNGDGVVNIFDLVIVAQNFGMNPCPGACNDPRADVNDDGQVNIFDLVIVAQNFGA